jgi:transcriptional regulator with XRE-family HTH domain
MGETRLAREIRERQERHRRALGEELRRTRLDVGVSVRSLGAAAGVDPSHLARAEAGRHTLSGDALVAAATALGSDVSVRLFRSDAPRIRDRIQAPMIEAFLDPLHPRWTPRLEVAVYRPVRGVIDLVLQDALTNDLVAGEGHGALHAVDA